MCMNSKIIYWKEKLAILKKKKCYQEIYRTKVKVKHWQDNMQTS